MNTIENHERKQKHSYISEYKSAHTKTASAGLAATNWSQLRQGPQADLIRATMNLANGMQSRLPKELPPHTACIQTTTIAYIMLRLAGVSVEAVIGDIVDGNGVGFFDTDAALLLEEHKSQVFKNKHLKIHAWLQIDNQLIADFAGHKYLAIKEWEFIATSEDEHVHIENIGSLWRQRLKYKPMLLGAELLCSLLPSPLFDYAQEHYSILEPPIGGQLVDSFEDFWKGYAEFSEDYILKAMQRISNGLRFRPL